MSTIHILILISGIFSFAMGTIWQKKNWLNVSIKLGLYGSAAVQIYSAFH